ETLPSADIGQRVEKFNINSLRKQLNNGNRFDVNLIHQERDILELHFTCKQKAAINNTVFYPGNLVYAFAYKKAKWRKTSYDSFGNNLSPIQVGKILTPFINQSKTESVGVPHNAQASPVNLQVTAAC